MAYPNWAGPFGIPETREEVEKFFWNTLLLTGVYTAAYALAVWHTIPRMATHHYWNPSRNAIIRAAARQTVFPSFGRGLGMIHRANPVFLFLEVGLLYGEVGRYSASSWGTAQDEARFRAMGIDDSLMSLIGAQSHPYIESPTGERMYYSFNPENI